LISVRHLLLSFAWLALTPAFAQEPVPANSEPLIFRDAGVQKPTADQLQRQLVEKLRAQLKEIAAADISDAEKHTRAKQLMLEHPAIFHDLGPDLQGSLALDQATAHLEKMFFEVAAADAASPAGKQQIMEQSPGYTPPQSKEPALIAPEQKPGEIETVADTSKVSVAKPTTTEPEQLTHSEKKKNKVEVAVLANESVTTAMHDDTTVLRDLKNDQGDLVLFDALHIWAGGDMQFDSYHFNNVFNYKNDGDSEATSDTRRAEAIIRARLYDLGEVKATYDFESKIYRDLYWRWVSKSADTSVTIGNQ
jgi:hypothetical protein